MTDTTSLPSPCISVCKINPATGQCLGCYRTREEIKAWKTTMSDTGRRELVSELHDRRAAITGRPRRQTRRASQAGN